MASWPYNTARWQRLRERHLRLQPLCQSCRAIGRVIIARAVDHVVPISAGGDAFPGHDGLRALCWPCHSAKTARGTEAGAVKSTKPRKGCNADGSPLDPEHPWNKAGGTHSLPDRPSSGPPPNSHNQLVSKESGNG